VHYCLVVLVFAELAPLKTVFVEVVETALDLDSGLEEVASAVHPEVVQMEPARLLLLVAQIMTAFHPLLLVEMSEAYAGIPPRA
jgi:hypothetical protein